MNAKKLILAFIVFLITISGISAEEKIPTGSILWKISGNGLTAPSYILGTHHIIKKEILDDFKGIDEALSNTDQVVGEIDMDEIASKSSFMQNAVIMPDSITYNQFLSEHDYAVLDSNLKAVLHVGLDKLSKLKPVTISFLYLFKIYGKDMQSEPMDLYFQQIAKENNKPIIGLETIEDQMQLLYYSTPIEKQILDLLCQTSNSEYTSKVIGELDDCYSKGDLNSILKFMNDENDPCPDTQEEKAQVNKDRNDKWLLKLPSIMAERASFIAVGCMHIAGEDGLLWQLKKMGYTVEPVK
ncbi:hypothetical protein CLV62_11788 [Dysgonomonas alginatilytica]|uniref:TraB family protein n=1 Tax=Dysgonomonas alginatilytica TaxID=1605892 RepID=A0A2V3PLT5_9BACT|nr:TraB/GumN family protein [Dysgonomonas alginatilytica]PXV62872.1 hypothetical protein CLV62_11788 [Dysgonomonas alginatilytica]